MGEGSWVGLDVHARSTVAGVLDGRSGELRVRRPPPESGQTIDHRRFRVRRAIGSRLIGATRSGLPGSCVWVSWWRCAFRSRRWRLHVISCAHARTRAAT